MPIFKLQKFGLALLLLTLPSCRFLECLGDGPTTYKSLSLSPSISEVVAGANPITIRVTGELNCAGQRDGLAWRLEPSIGTLENTEIQGQEVRYRPPATIASHSSVKIIVEYLGLRGRLTTTETTIQVLKQ